MSRVRSQVHQARVQVTTVQDLVKLLRGSSRNEGKQQPIHKKMWFKRKKNEKKEKIPWPRFEQGPPKCKVISQSPMAHCQILILGKANYYICQHNSASKCCLKLVELYLSRIERYPKKLSRVLTVKALFKLISLHLKNIILWPTTNKCLVHCCKVFYCRPCIHCSSLHLHEENRPFHGL